MSQAPADAAPPVGLGILSGLAGVGAVLFLGYLALSQRPAEKPTAATTNLAAPPELGACLMDQAGYLAGQLYGALNMDLDWSGAALACEGNARPGDRGLRLFFAGRPGQREDRLVLVLGIPSRVEALAGGEHEVNLTIIDEAAARFFNSGGGRCWSRVHEVVPLDVGPDEAYRVDGELYCAGAIPSLTDSASVTPGSIRYSGRLTLGGG